MPGVVPDRPRSTIPWLLVAASALLVVIVFYLLFAAYLPTKKRVARLEAELRDTYTREAQLQTKLSQQEQKQSVREQEIAAFTAERAALARRLEELEQELAATKGPKKPPASPRR